VESCASQCAPRSQRCCYCITSGSKASCITASPPRSALHREASALRRQETPDLQVSAFYHLHRIEPWMLTRWTNDHRKATAIDQRPPAIQPNLSGALLSGDHGQATLFHFHEPGSSLDNVLGYLQMSMYGD
jgi:hypothetical protein